MYNVYEVSAIFKWTKSYILSAGHQTGTVPERGSGIRRGLLGVHGTNRQHRHCATRVGLCHVHTSQYT